MRLMVLALCLLFVCCVTGYAKSKSSFFFVQVADTQLGFSTQNKDLGPDVANFEKAVEHINRLKPAFVVISGDLTNAAEDPAQTEAFFKVVRKINKGIRVCLVAGNHDMYKADKEDIASYRKTYGDDYYSFTTSNSTFIVLDTPLIWHKTGDPDIRQQQYNWFEKQLQNARQKQVHHIFVMTHFPWFLEKPNEADVYWTVPQTQRKPYLDLMDKYGVDYAIAGHFHREAIGTTGAMTMITTAPLAVAMGPEPIGLKIFKVYPDRVESQLYPLNNIPEKVQL